MAVSRPTTQLRRWLVFAGLSVVVLLGAALAVIRIQFEGPDLAQGVTTTLNRGILGRVEIGSIDWPMKAITKIPTGGWVPVVLHDVEVWDEDAISVLETPRISAELDLHSLMFGRHDVVLRRVRVEGGRVLLREVSEPYPLHDYDTTVFSIMSAFYGRRTAGYHLGVFAASSPLWDLRDITIRDVDFEVRTKPEDDYYVFRARIEHLDADGFLYMDPSDPLVPKFYVSLTPHGGPGQIDIIYEQNKDGSWPDHGEYSFPIDSITVHRLAQLPGGWPADPVANTLSFDVELVSRAGARARMQGSMRDYWDTAYGGDWDVTTRIDNAGPMLAQSLLEDLGGDNVTVESVLKGPIVYYPSISIDVRGLTYEVPGTAPTDPALAPAERRGLLLELDNFQGRYDLAVDEGAVDEFVARGAGGEVKMSARFGGDGSDASPLWTDLEADIRKPVTVGPYLPPALVVAAGSDLGGRFHAVRRIGDTRDGFTIDGLDLRLGRLRVSGGPIGVDVSLSSGDIKQIDLTEVHLDSPTVAGTVFRCVLDFTYDVPVVLAEPRCRGTNRVGSVQQLIQTLNRALAAPTTPAATRAPVRKGNKATRQPRGGRPRLRAPGRPWTGGRARATRSHPRGHGGARATRQAQPAPPPPRGKDAKDAKPAPAAKDAAPAAPRDRDTSVGGEWALEGGPVNNLDGEFTQVFRDVPLLGSVTAHVRKRGDRIQVVSATSGGLGGRVSARGSVRLTPLWIEAMHVTASQVELGRVGTIENRVTGKLSADLTVRGPPDPRRMTFEGWACSDRLVVLGEALSDVAVWLDRPPTRAASTRGRRTTQPTCSTAAPPPEPPEGFDPCLRVGASGGRCLVARARREAGGELGVVAHADRGDRLGGHLQVSRLPLAALVKLVGGTLPADAVIDTGGAGLTLGGTVDAPTVAGSVRITRAWFEDGYLGDGEMTVTPAGPGKIRFSGRFLDGRIAVTGTLGTRAPYPLELTADVAHFEVDTFIDLASLGAPAGTTAWMTGRVTLLTSLGDPNAPLTAQLEINDLAVTTEVMGPDGDPLPVSVRTETPLSIGYDGKVARLLQPARLHTPLGTIKLQGEASPVALDVSASGRLDLGHVQPLFGRLLDQASGAVAFSAQVSGRTADPDVRVTLEVEDVAIRLARQDNTLRIPLGKVEFKDDALSFTGLSIQVDEGYGRVSEPLTVGGGVTFAGTTPSHWALAIQGQLAGEMLMAAAPEVFAQASGSANLSVSLGGDGPTPTISGTLDLNPEEGKRPLTLVPRRVRREVTLSEGEITFEGTAEVLSFRTEQAIGGRIDDEGTLRSIEGSLTLVDWEPIRADVVVSADALPFRLERTLDMVVSIDGGHLTYDRTLGIDVAGRVELVSGRYSRNFNLGEYVTPTAPSGPSAPPVWETDELIGGARLDNIEVAVRKFSVVNNLANIDLDGNLTISGTPRQPRFDGTIFVQRGTFRLPGVRPRFTRTSGTVVFEPRLSFPAATPTLDITSEADYRDPSGQDHLITFRITDTLSQLGWDLTTSTGLTKGQTLTLILSGRTPEDFRRTVGDQAVTTDPTRIDPSTDTSQGYSDELVKQFAGDLLERGVADTLRELSGLDVARIELNLGSFGFHGEARVLENVRVVGDLERTTRGSTINARLELRLPPQFLAGAPVLGGFGWWRGAMDHVSSIATEINGLIKNYDDAAETDINDAEIKLVFKLLFGK